MRKFLSTTIAAGIFVSMGISPVFADVAATATPVFNHGTNVDVTKNGNNMNVQIQGGQYSVGTAYWDSFNLGKDASVNFEFTAHNQTSMNYVDAASGMSQIYGQMTNSGCYGCGYAGTGKVVLINPNGILFGDGANINLNSFTATTMNSTYDEATKKLSLTRNADSKNGIIVQEGAKIYGDKNVAFVSDDINIYKGSQISTNIGNNTDDAAYGKVKLVTSDGVNFTYYNNGAIDQISDVKTSADKMTLWVAGDITAGHIDARNASTNTESELNTNGAVLKAYKAEKGNDGNIWLTANNKVITEDTTLTTANATTGAAAKSGGNVRITSGNKTTLNADSVSAVGNVTLISTVGDVNVDNSAIYANDITLEAGNVASIQNASAIQGADVKLTGTNRAQITGASTVNANNVTLEGGNVWFDRANITADTLTGKANTGYVLSNGSSTFNAGKVNLDAATDVTGTFDLVSNKGTIKAGNDIDVTIYNVGNRENGLVAEAGKNVTVTTPGTLSVGSLVAKNGDMTITANNVIAGKDYAPDSAKIPGDTDDIRSFISVENGTFTSNTANDAFYVTASDTPIDGTTNYMRHHIQYGNGTEKIVLRNPRPYVYPPVPAVVAPLVVDDSQARMLNKIPRQPEAYNNKTTIADGRTTFVDVFAAASQIEIEDDEE